MSNDFPVYRTKRDKCSERYLELITQDPSFVEMCRAASSGTSNRQRLNMDAFTNMQVALPSLDAQARVSHLFDVFDRAIHWHQEVGKLETQAYVSVLSSLIDGGTHQAQELGTHIESIESGKSPKALDRPPIADERGVLKVSAVRRGRFVPEEAKALHPDTQMPVRARVREGDLLMTRANTNELVGSVCVVPSFEGVLFLSDKTLRLNLAATLRSEYAQHALASESVRAQIREVATGTSASMKNISQAKIRRLSIPVPNLRKQQEIAVTLRGFSDAAIARGRAAESLVDLRSSLLLTLLSGEHEIPESYDRFLSEVA